MTTSGADLFASTVSAFLAPPVNIVSGLRVTESFTTIQNQNGLHVEYFVSFQMQGQRGLVERTTAHIEGGRNGSSRSHLMSLSSGDLQANVVSYLNTGRNGVMFSNLFRTSLMATTTDPATLALYSGVSVSTDAYANEVPTSPTFMPSAAPVESGPSSTSSAKLLMIVVPAVVGSAVIGGCIAFFLYRRNMKATRYVASVTPLLEA